MSAAPIISLATPALNQARFIETALLSAESQNYPRLEHLVVDGGSTDGTLECIKRHGDRLAWWTSEPDSGMYEALNKGFARSTGEIMGWLNCDDLLLPGALATVASIFASCPEVQWLSSTTVSTWSADGVSTGTTTLPGFSREAFLERRYLPEGQPAYGWIPQESTFWRRSLWESAGGKLDSALRLAGDFDLWARFFASSELIGTPALIGGFRSQPDQKSRALDPYRQEARPAIERLAATLGHRPNRFRDLLLRSRLAGVPGLRGALARSFGYTATRAVPDGSGGWRLENYRFL